MMKSKSAAVALAVLAGLVVVLLAFAGSSTREEEYRSFPSPDGRFRVVVFRVETQTAMMPGQAGDAPGVVRLYDRKGKLLHETTVAMVQLVDHVDWQPGRVTIKLIADWKLPDN
jgi:hypothetical protein